MSECDKTSISDKNADTSVDDHQESDLESKSALNDPNIKDLNYSKDPETIINELQLKLSETQTNFECKVHNLEEKCKVLENQLENALRKKEAAEKEKENMVIRYAVGEKAVLQERSLKESFERKFKEQVRENEILVHKVQSMNTEKARICQMLDNKCYELRTAQSELERMRGDLQNLETKLKWSQNSLKTEISAHKEAQNKIDVLTQKINDLESAPDSQLRKQAELEEQNKELQAQLILARHERQDHDQQLRTALADIERLQAKQRDMLDENNGLSVKIQQLERERLESEQKLSDLRACADQQRQDAASLATLFVQLEQIKSQLKHTQDQLEASKEEVNVFKQRNGELESDMEACRVREAELLLFTQQLTDKNVRLQSEFTAMETKVQQLTCEQTMLKRNCKEQEARVKQLSEDLEKERQKYKEEKERLREQLAEVTKNSEMYKQEAVDQKGENAVIKRKLELSLREVTKELQHCRKKLEQFEQMECSSSNSSSTSNIAERMPEPPPLEQAKPPDDGLDRQTLIEHIAKLQRISAKKSEKLDFLEEHVNTLVLELQKKSRLLQGYILREQGGAVTSNKMDSNKARLAKMSGVMELSK